MLSLLWGSILFVSARDACLIGATACALAVFVAALDKELRAMLFSRALAGAAGIHEHLVWALFLAMAALTITVNLTLVGGLMLFSLLICPAASAFQLCRGYVPSVLVAAGLGAAIGVAGFVTSYVSGAPTGACICVIACAAFAVTSAIRYTLRMHN